MANANKGEVDRKFNGKPIRLALTINGLAELEEETGKTLQDMMPLIHRGSISAARGVLWCSMLEHWEGATIKDAGNLAQELGEDLGPTMELLVSRCGFLSGDPDDASEGSAPGK